MAEALTGLLDRMVSLVEGAVSPTRSIDTNQFKHIEIPVEQALPQAAKAPYPLNLEPMGWDPEYLEVQSDVSGNYRYDAHLFRIRVGYSTRPHEAYQRSKQVAEDYYKIRRTLTDPASYASGSGFNGCNQRGESTIRQVQIGTGTTDAYMVILEIPFVLLYREDHS